MAPWLPPDQLKALQIPNLPNENSNITAEKNDTKQSRKQTTAVSQQLSQSKTFSMSGEASSDLKKALEVCEYGINITNGENLADLVSLKTRFPLIKAWVIAKQFNQSTIKNLGISKNISVKLLYFYLIFENFK